MKCPKCGMELKGSVCTYCNYDTNSPKKDGSSKVFYVLLAIITVIISLGGSYLIITNNKVIPSKETKVVDYSNVSIKEEGISASVLKVYDAVVVVKTYVKDTLYATGTGFVLKEDDKYGYILTNYHVIEDGSNFKVRFTNDEEVEATLVGGDSYSDVAILKVDKQYILTVANIGSSNDSLVGDTVFTVGSPIDADVYSWSVTRGILSGKDRIVEVKTERDSTVMNVLQTDASINSGNSGGPLCNVNGEVIGITNMKLNSSYASGMGFAIPIEVALEYADNFISGKPIVRPYLGIAMYDLSTSFFAREEGIYIREVEPNSPADKAGLKKGDIIIKIDGKDTTSVGYLRYYLYKHKVSDIIEVTYKRDSKEETTKVTLGSYDIRS